MLIYLFLDRYIYTNSNKTNKQTKLDNMKKRIEGYICYVNTI